MKRNKHFYHHLVGVDSIHLALDDLGLSPDEKQELGNIIDDNIHHVVLDAVLSELEERDKKAFLTLMLSDDHDEIWNLLSDKIEDVEGKIKKSVERLVDKLQEDIKEAHKKK